MVRKLFSFCLLLCVGILPVMAKVTATLDRTTVKVDETMTLVINSDSPLNASPDLSVMPDKIQVLQQMQFSNSQYINGQRTYKGGWQIQLIAVDQGVTQIPSIQVGNESTQPIDVHILPSNNANQGELKPFYLEAELSNPNPFVQEQTVLTIKVHSDADIDNAQIKAPSISNAFITPLGTPAQYVTREQETLYRIWEFKYSIASQTAGTLQVPSFIFQGDKIIRHRTRGPLSLLSPQTRPVQLKTKALDLTIKPAKDLSTTWLPAQHLTLESYWRPPFKKLKVGEPVTRIIEIKAKGLDAAQLPEFKMEPIDGLSWFPNQAIRNNKIENGQIEGSVLQRIALMPNKAGHYTLPALNVRWWDLQTNSFKTETMDALEVDVTGIPIINPVTQQDISHPLGLKPVAVQNAELMEKNSQQLLIWRAIAITTMLLWVLTMLAWRISTSKKSSLDSVEPNAIPSRNEPISWKKLAKLITKKSPLEAYNLLKHNLPEKITNIENLMEILRDNGENESASLIQELSEMVYSKEQQPQINPLLVDCIAALETQLNRHKKSANQDYKNIINLYTQDK